MEQPNSKEDLNERPDAAESLSAERMNICNVCDNLTPIVTCSVCNCIMPIKVLFKKSSCPLGKW